MRNLTRTQTLAMIIILGASIMACDGCPDKLNTWLDEHTIEIPKTDDTPPTAWFEVTDAKTGKTTRVDQDTSFSLRNGDALDIVFWGQDLESGIKSLCLHPGFYQKCCTIDSDPGLCYITQPSVFDQCVDMPVIDTEAFLSWFMFSEINVNMPCSSGYELDSGSYSLTGTVKNSLEATTNISIVVNVVP